LLGNSIHIGGGPLTLRDTSASGPGRRKDKVKSRLSLSRKDDRSWKTKETLEVILVLEWRKIFDDLYVVGQGAKLLTETMCPG
jgi:hypothetical protein